MRNARTLNYEITKFKGMCSRKRILELLAEGPKSTGFLIQKTELCRSSISRHLNRLEKAGIIERPVVGTVRLIHDNA